MKKLLFIAVLLAPAAYADCVDDVVAAQADIEAIVGALDARQQVELTATLLELCDKRVVGSSVLENDDRRAFTTHGLNPEQVKPVSELGSQGVPVIIDAEVASPETRKARSTR
jgi:hypothetical protein